MTEIDRIYASLPKLKCQGKCQRSCGPILMSRVEWERIGDCLGLYPEGDASLVCPMLDRATGRCSVYLIRPLICRLWGMVRKMRCPWGCRPERWVSDKEARELLARIEKASVKSEGGE